MKTENLLFEARDVKNPVPKKVKVKIQLLDRFQKPSANANYNTYQRRLKFFSSTLQLKVEAESRRNL